MQPRFSKAMLPFVPYKESHLEMKHKLSFPYKMLVCLFPLLDCSLCHSHHKLHQEIVVNYSDKNIQMQKKIKIKEYEQDCLDWTFELQIAIAGLTG